MSEHLLSRLEILLREAIRDGADRDTPEGVRYIRISDTLANKLADQIEAFRWELGDNFKIDDTALSDYVEPRLLDRVSTIASRKARLALELETLN